MPVKGAAERKRRCRAAALTLRNPCLEKFDEGDDQAALGDQRAEHPLHKLALRRLDGCAGLLPQGVDVGPDRSDIGLGGEVGVEEGDVRLGESLDLFLVEAALGS